MTLTDFVDMIHTENVDLIVYVFENEGDRDEYRRDGNKSALLFMASSPYVMSFYLHEQFANAKVLACCPVDAKHDGHYH